MMKRKLLIGILSVAACTALTVGLAACGSSMAGNAKKVSLGDTQEKVRSIFGNPYGDDPSNIAWYYYDDAYTSLMEDIQAGSASPSELDTLTYSYTEVRFQAGEENKYYVSSVIYDSAYCEGKAVEDKEVAEVSVSPRYDLTVARVVSQTMRFSARVIYEDGSYSLTYPSNIAYEIKGNSVALRWRDTFAECEATVSLTSALADGFTLSGIVGGGAVSVAIADGVTKIPAGVLNTMNSIKLAEIPASVTEIEVGAFSANALEGLELEWDGGVGYLSDWIFKADIELIDVTLKAGARGMYGDVFANCDLLESIAIADSNALFHTKDGVLYDKDMTEFVHIPRRISGTLTIPSGVKEIGVSAFSGYKYLRGVVIPGTVTSVGARAFLRCDALESVTFSGEPQVTVIGERAFNECKQLKQIVLPDTVTTLGDFAFAACTALTSVGLSGVQHIGRGAFSGCTALAAITLPESVNAIGDTAFSGCTALTKIELPAAVTALGANAFEGCTALADVTLDKALKNIGQEAFSGCTALTTIKFAGTAAEWNAIEKAQKWDEGLDNYTITYLG